jgi:hypothetical protein
VGRDGNGYPRPVTRLVFLPLGGWSGSDFVHTGILVGQILYPTGLWAQVCFVEPRASTCGTKTYQQFMYHACRTSKLGEQANDELQIQQQGPNFVLFASCNCNTIYVAFWQ